MALPLHFEEKIAKIFQKPPNILNIFVRFDEKFIDKSLNKFVSKLGKKYSWYILLQKYSLEYHKLTQIMFLFKE